MSEKDWQEEYRRSSVKSLYTVQIQSLEQHITFGQWICSRTLTVRACIAIYKCTGQLLFAVTVVY